jgi:hypothetical protein
MTTNARENKRKNNVNPVKEKAKVYCKNCKYYCGPIFENPCGKYWIIKSKYTGEITKTEWNDNNNKNGDCKYYKRKWWKFWIKGEA